MGRASVGALGVGLCNRRSGLVSFQPLLLLQIRVRTWLGSASSALSASVRAVRICVNCGRGRATAGTTARVSGRAATMRRESMLCSR